VPDLDFAALRRWPDVEAHDLVAWDATDRLLLDEAQEALAASPTEVAVIGDRHGALTLGAAARGATGLRVHQDALQGERALAANASRLGVAPTWEQHPLDASLVEGARVVLLQLPRELDALDEVAGLVARSAPPGVVLFAGGRVKHMTLAMNDVLRRHFGDVHASLARQKSRVLVASRPLPGPGGASGEAGAGGAGWPREQRHLDLGLTVAAHGRAFAGTSVDIGTRALLGVLADALPEARDVVDLGCGTGVLAASVALARPGVQVVATDQSAAAVASAGATARANGVGDRVRVVRADAGDALAEGSADLVLLNPPFHVGAAVNTGLAPRLFDAAARLLRPGGELWTVYNSHLAYRPALEASVGPTRQVLRTPKFTVTASTRR
jgi:16S rRNA (guanine1207-N2)-methyltransferase